MSLAKIAIGVTLVVAAVLLAVSVVGLLSTGPVTAADSRSLLFGVSGMFASVVAGIAGLILAATTGD